MPTEFSRAEHIEGYDRVETRGFAPLLCLCVLSQARVDRVLWAICIARKVLQWIITVLDPEFQKNVKSSRVTKSENGDARDGSHFMAVQGATAAVAAAVVFLWSLCTAAAAPDISPNIIYYNTGNTTPGSTFQQNLRTVFSYLFDVTQLNGSATYGYGVYPDTVYGFSECYNMSQGDCGQCFDIATKSINDTAPLAVGAQTYVNDTVYRCYLRYENYNFKGYVISANASAPPAPLANGPTPPNDGGGGSKTTPIVVGTVVAAAVLVLSGACAGWYFLCLKAKTPSAKHLYDPEQSYDLEGSIEGPRVYRYEELRIATENFIQKNKLGQGGFGTVYKGTLSDGTVVAIKQLSSVVSHQGKDEFVNEVSIISGIQQRNLVKLKGYCIEDDHRLLVLELLSNGSLDRALFGGAIALDWPARYEIAVGVARGLAYLHEESDPQIIHRDIKGSNILLDDKLKPKISDFGISKLFNREKGFTSTRVAGTFGYLAPEYALRGRLTAKADVFSFGVLLLETLSGRKCSDSSLPPEQEILIEWARIRYEKGELESLIDASLELTDHSRDEVLRTFHIALLCTQQDPEARPIMSKVVAMLLGYLEIPHTSMEAPPAYLTRPQTWTTSSSSSDTKSSSRLSSQTAELAAR